jgi:hypothetical protein
VFFSDEAWYFFRGEVSYQNGQCRSAENPGFIDELSFHDEKIGV